MIGYGLPRNSDVAFPDVADCALYGRPSRFHTLKSKAKRSSRRIWKRRARRMARMECCRD